jgi:hypothetical protein
MVIDVAALLEFPHHRAAAMAAIDKAREGEVALVAPELAGVAGIEDALNALPKLAGDERLIFAPAIAALPFEVAGVDAVPQDRVHPARGHRLAGADGRSRQMNLG